MKTRLSFSIGVSAFTALFCAQAAPVTNWHTFKATSATTLSGQGTSSPTIGNAAAPANSAFAVGYFNGVSLTNLGDRITFSYLVSFTDAGGIATSGDQLRFALFDINGQTPVTADNTAGAGLNGQTDNWRGYWFGHRGGTGTGSAGSIRERAAALTSATENPFSNTTADPATSLGTVGGTSVPLASSTNSTGGPVYSGMMSLERTPSGIALAGSFAGNGGTNIFLAKDDAAPFPATYGAVAYLFGNAMNVDQVNLQNVSVNYAVSNALQITSHPANVSVNPGQAAQFSVSWTGSGIIPSIQWRENGIDIPNATNATHIVASASLAQNNNTYSVVIQNVFGDSVTSSNATLSVVPDSTKPKVISASSLVANIINVIFSEPVDSASAVNSGNYSLAGNSIADRTLISSTNVALTLDTPIASGTYVLNVQNVQDLSGNFVTSTNVQGRAHGFQGAAKVGITNDNGGFAYAVDEKIEIFAMGADIFGTKDEFEYVFKTYTGDFDVSVKTESLVNTDANAKAGLMARANTSDNIFADSRNVMITATPARFLFQYRENELGTSVAVATPRPPTDFPNCWLRLKRVGSVISGYTSTNLSQWTLVSSLDTALSTDGAYPASILVGLGVTSHSANNLTEAVYSGFGNFVEIPVITISRSGSNVNLQWPAAATGFVLQRTSSLTAPVSWTDIAGSETSNQASIPVGSGPTFFRLRQ